MTFIVPDTFMFLHHHSKLRKLLLTHARIEEILIFPSRFFPGVSFGYSNLSIITLERATREQAASCRTRIVRGFRSASEFRLLLDENAPCGHLEIASVSQAEALAGDDHRFVLGDSAWWS